MKHKLKKAALAGAIALAMAIPASATTFDADALDKFVETASACIIGQVTNIEHEQRGSFVVTMATVQVSRTAFGSTASEIKVMIPGGPIPNSKIPVAVTVAGAPQLNVGQNFMLVLNDAQNANEYTVAGLSEGAIAVVNTADGPQVSLPNSQGRMTLDSAIEGINTLRDGEAGLE